MLPCFHCKSSHSFNGNNGSCSADLTTVDKSCNDWVRSALLISSVIQWALRTIYCNLLGNKNQYSDAIQVRK
ncbi:hypothetical protein M378DRAFT_465942 [Amanita muscaria Koide BX008]|uniref:Uncharacterized protein n=1 Tax=Amanita muscaria (strain Koide BX008) TaxID=946122 RepID=A0A0C2WIR4_AMAMK|nr:hypothetical protein M378DRAFT_465942 [Amanita muscaria Koide BX008]